MGATPAFNNAGTFTQSTGITFNGVSLNNSGTVNVSSGTLLLEDDGNDKAGVFNVASGATLEFIGANTITHLGSSIGTATNPSAGTIIFDEFGTDFTGSANISGQTEIESGTVNFYGTLTSLGQSLTISGGSHANIATSVTIPFLDLIGGTLGGDGAVTVSKALYWNNGSYMVDTGSTTLAKGANLSLGGDGTSLVLDSRTFNNYGSVSWAGNSGTFYMYNGAVFNNEVGASFTANADQTIDDAYGTTAKFNNAGTFTKISANSGPTDFANVLFNNTGTVNVNSGIIELDTGGTDSAGTFNVASGGKLYFAGGITTLASSITASGSGLPPTVLFSAGTTDVTGTYNLANGVTTISGATVNFTASSTLTSLGGVVTIIGSGTANFSANTTIPVLYLTGGTLTGSGTVTVSSQLTWDGGSTMSGTGSTTLAASGTATLGGDSTELVLDGRTFNNAGNITMPANTVALSMVDQAVFNNEAGATFTGTSYAWFSPYAFGTATFNNAGTFSAVDTWFGGVTFNNTGTVNLPTNAPFEMDSGGSNSGAFVLSSGSDLDLADGFDNFSASTASITGAGSVFVGFATVYFGGTFDITGDTTVGAPGGPSIGTAYFLDGGQTGTLSSSLSAGTMELTAGTTFSVTNGNCTIDGGSVYLNGGTLALAAGNSVILENGAALYGPGTLNGNLDNGVSFPGYVAAAVYVGGGQFPGTLTINGNYVQDSNGALYVDIGGATAGSQYDQLKISGTATLNGTLDISLINGYKPSHGAFDILTFASHSGDFATKILPSGWSASPASTDYVATA
jgi:hypothetical protein